MCISLVFYSRNNAFTSINSENRNHLAQHYVYPLDVISVTLLPFKSYIGDGNISIYFIGAFSYLSTKCLGFVHMAHIFCLHISHYGYIYVYQPAKVNITISRADVRKRQKINKSDVVENTIKTGKGWVCCQTINKPEDVEIYIEPKSTQRSASC